MTVQNDSMTACTALVYLIVRQHHHDVALAALLGGSRRWRRLPRRGGWQHPAGEARVAAAADRPPVGEERTHPRGAVVRPGLAMGRKAIITHPSIFSIQKSKPV